MTGLARYPELEIVRVGDIDVARAKQAAAEHAIPAWGDDAELYADDSVDIVINLTPPVHHARTVITALEAGKHVYVEKPLARPSSPSDAHPPHHARTPKRTRMTIRHDRIAINPLHWIATDDGWIDPALAPALP